MDPNLTISNCSLQGGGIYINNGKVKTKDIFYTAVKDEKIVPFRTEDEAIRFVSRRLGWKVKDAYFTKRLV